MRDSAGEAKTKLCDVHMEGQVLANQQEFSYHSSCADTGCSLEDLAGVMDYKDGLRERETDRATDRVRVREIRDSSATWWRGWVTFVLVTVATIFFIVIFLPLLKQVIQVLFLTLVGSVSVV